MLDHLGISVKDIAKARRFYETSLAPLGFGVVMEVTEAMTGNGSSAVGFGAGKPDFWISANGGPGSHPVHVAFSASDRAAVDAFYAAAIAAGGTDNGKPGLRAMYHPSYYGAFVFDPDGNNVEAVCHKG